jgi:hypothetical protein
MRQKEDRSLRRSLHFQTQTCAVGSWFGDALAAAGRRHPPASSRQQKYQGTPQERKEKEAKSPIKADI